MPRSKWKISHIDSQLFSVVTQLHRTMDNIHRIDPDRLTPLPETAEEKRRTRPVRLFTNARNSSIITPFCGLTIQVHNGRKFQPLKMSSKIVDKKIGEFVHTRKVMKHKDTKKKVAAKKK
jgi:small subunit ribosomal protein S19